MSLSDKIVVPAQAGTQGRGDYLYVPWAPACAGATEVLMTINVPNQADTATGCATTGRPWSNAAR